MILSIGEILADMIGENLDGVTNYKTFCGGAPFNVAVNAKQAGAEVGFIGKVGRDPVGKFLIDFAKKANLDYLDISTDEVRNTTLAFVTLTDGERDFAFFRHETADYNLNADEIDLDSYENLSIVHLGSLMLSEKIGQDFAKKMVKKTKKAGKMLSFDVNFRMDLYKDVDQAISAYKPYVESADILKFSDDEIMAFAKKDTLEESIKAVYKKDRLLLITLGSKGSMFVYNDESQVIPTEKVKPVDTTGAGDAFFGALLANLDGVEFNKQNITSAMEKANKAGANATQFKGGIKL